MPQDDHLPGYTIRRSLSGRQLLPAVGAGVALGLVGFYVAKLLMERTPLLTPADRKRRGRVLARIDDGRDDAAWYSEEIAIDEPEDAFAALDDEVDDERFADLEDDLEDELEDEFQDDLGLAERVREARERR